MPGVGGPGARFGPEAGPEGGLPADIVPRRLALARRFFVMSALYDLTLLLDTAAAPERREEILSDVESRLRSEGEIVGRHDWGVRTLAYEIEHKTDADYHLFQFHGPATPARGAGPEPEDRRRRRAVPHHQAAPGHAPAAEAAWRGAPRARRRAACRGAACRPRARRRRRGRRGARPRGARPRGARRCRRACRPRSPPLPEPAAAEPAPSSPLPAPAPRARLRGAGRRRARRLDPRPRAGTPDVAGRATCARSAPPSRNLRELRAPLRAIRREAALDSLPTDFNDENRSFAAERSPSWPRPTSTGWC